MASITRAKHGYLTYQDMLNKITDGTLDAYDVIYTYDTKENYVISPELKPWSIKSKIYTFSSIQEANDSLNNQSDTYVGQIVSVLSGDVYKGFIVNSKNNSYYIESISNGGTTSDYNLLTNIPIINLSGTLDNPITISELDSGIYSVKGQYKIDASDVTTYINPNSDLFIVQKDADSISIKKISSHDIIDYSITDSVVKTNQIVTENYLIDNNYTTTIYVDEKISALELLLKQDIKDYIDSIFEELDEKIDARIDAKIKSASEEEIVALFNKN